MYVRIIQDSIDYIEDNIKCDISASELSKKAGFSVFHYYRLFQTAVAEKMLFPIGCVIFAVAVFAILNHFDLLWYMW